MRKNILYICLPLLFSLLGFANLQAQTNLQIIKSNPKCATSYAVFVDSKTFDACKAEIMEYKNVLESEGLGTYILSAQWNKPEEIKAQIEKLGKSKQTLEGFSFVGDIPIVRALKAQHMTTALKRSEYTNPKEETAVASDRYYDCSALQWSFVAQDEKNPIQFYYALEGEGAQHLYPNYYSARILVPEEYAKTVGIDKYELMRRFFKKAVEAHKEQNQLDNFIYFAGSGYNSDCLTAWRQQQFVFNTYFPQAFETSKGNKFLNFRQEPVMKYTLFHQLEVPGTDMFFFYEHGAEDTQYINGAYPARSFEENVEWLLRDLRNSYRRIKDAEKKADFVKEACAHYGLPESVLSDAEMAKWAKADSIAKMDKDIHLPDLAKLTTSPRFTMFNACYNGSFHVPGYVAGYHIFNDGRTVVTQGNTVNVLQDKWAEQLIGILGLGARAGFWQKEVATLESHMVGDPTFKFATPERFIGDRAETLCVEDINKVLATKCFDKAFWEGVLADNDQKNPTKRSDEYAPLFRALAIKNLSKCYLTSDRSGLTIGENTPFSDQLLDIFKNDRNMVVRLQALYALSMCADKNFQEAVALGFDDVSEMVRRQSAHFTGRIGDPAYAEKIFKVVENSLETQRVQYASESALVSLAHFAKNPMNGYPHPGFYFNFDRNNYEFDPNYKSDINHKRIQSEIRAFRNHPEHQQYDHLLGLLADTNVEKLTRIYIAEAFGWFSQSMYRKEIVGGLKDILAQQPSMDDELKDEIIKTINRLEFKIR
ncbi:MAG: HEAT repeat domain-containing protein [Bacteroidales bacterium]|nr:HEAT repeat domain-containing protein [Bacteroidales bacterium]